EIWLRVQQMMKGSDIGIQEKKAKLFNEWERFTSTDGESIESYYHRFLKLMNDFKRNKQFLEKIAMLYQDQPSLSTYIQQPLNNNIITQPSFNQKYMQQPMPNLKYITDLTTTMNMALALMAKVFKLNYSTPTNNSQRISSNPHNRHIAQPCMNMGQDRQMQMVGGNGVQNVGNKNGLIVVPGIANQNPNGNGNLVAARVEGNVPQNNAGSKYRPPMLNKENYVPWSFCLLRYAKSRPNGKLIHNSIIIGPYVRRMIPEPGDPNSEIPVNETFHVQIDDELTEKELKQIKADDQAIQTILLGSDIGIQEKNAKLFNEWERFTSTDGESIESYYHRFLKLMNDFKRNKQFLEKIAILYQDQPSLSTYIQQPLNNNIITQPSFNQNYMQQPMPNLKYITDLTTTMNMALALMAKAFKLNYSTPTNNNQRISSNPCNRQIAQPCMNMGQDRQMQMVGGNVQYPGVQNVGNKNGLIVVPGIANQNRNGNGNLVAAQVEGNVPQNNGNQIRCYNYRGLGHFARNCTNVGNQFIQNAVHNLNGTGNLVAARAEGNATGHNAPAQGNGNGINGNQIRCYNCRGEGHYASNCIVKPRKWHDAYLQQQLQMAQEEEAGIQSTQEEFEFMDAADSYEET
nr:hypothetical protein [Tanacetum cinerariifolium]